MDMLGFMLKCTTSQCVSQQQLFPYSSSENLLQHGLLGLVVFLRHIAAPVFISLCIIHGNPTTTVPITIVHHHNKDANPLPTPAPLTMAVIVDSYSPNITMDKKELNESKILTKNSIPSFTRGGPVA